MPGLSDYAAIHYLINHENFPLTDAVQKEIEGLEITHQFNPTKTQAEEILQRYSQIRDVMRRHVVEPGPLEKKIFSDKLDNILLHRVWGNVILLAVLFILFQSVYWLASFPMDGIEWAFAKGGSSLSAWLPETWWSNLIVNGLVAGLSGILVFVPQIMILFGLIISFLLGALRKKVDIFDAFIEGAKGGFETAQNPFWKWGNASPRGLFGDGISVESHEQYYKAVSPLYLLPEAGYKLPPQFVLVGSKDGLTTPEVASGYVSVLKAAGQQVEFKIYEGKGHGFLDSGCNDYTKGCFKDLATPTLDDMIKFLDSVFN